MENATQALVLALLLASTTGHTGGPRYDVHPFGKACKRSAQCSRGQECVRHIGFVLASSGATILTMGRGRRRAAFACRLQKP